MKLEEDTNSQCVCFGAALKPIRNCNYEKSKEMWMYRAYNGFVVVFRSLLRCTLCFLPRMVLYAGFLCVFFFGKVVGAWSRAVCVFWWVLSGVLWVTGTATTWV
jgi:hypothetical protein